MEACDFVIEIGGKAINCGRGATGLIRVALEQLRAYRATTPNPVELEWEIRLYEFILAQPNAEEAAAAYQKTRHRGGGSPLPKREVAARLGWRIP